MKQVKFMLTLTDAFPFICHSNGSTKQACGSPQMARAGVNNPVIATKVLIRRGNLWAYAVACHTVCIVCLVHHASRASRTHDITTRLCEDEKGRLNDTVLPGFLIFTTNDLVSQNLSLFFSVF